MLFFKILSFFDFLTLSSGKGTICAIYISPVVYLEFANSLPILVFKKINLIFFLKLMYKDEKMRKKMINSKLPRSTKIVATIGTATDETQIIKNLIQTGVNVFRLNFSHGNHGDHLKRITYIRTAEKEMNVNVAILADLQGPKFRIGAVKNETKVIKGVITFLIKFQKLEILKG